jgi:hypothetical protein
MDESIIGAGAMAADVVSPDAPSVLEHAAAIASTATTKAKRFMDVLLRGI